ncbi:class I SAM-dependent methyltransferase [Virgibacillus salexigens]|uniref:class I SAM-dependent methyltransferase n=1 Tax=Virgibacillus TaxID=84406 RepID=UPI00136E2CE7|nr:class I SAM-dependent methyltransferase [Virgibacillus massiliensis]MYL43500.1 methyltransferase domain-containing protein [Virgibacillus massiliensis]
MKQNKYDDVLFFNEYKKMPRSIGGLEAAGEWPVFQQMLPNMREKRVLDLGCGFGWHCRYAKEQGARAVVGVDISERMLERAREETKHHSITYKRTAIEDIEFAPDSFDIVISSLAFHYVKTIDVVFYKVFQLLKRGGAFVFSVEHPIFTSQSAQDWYYDSDGNRLHWPVDNYQTEGIRHTMFLTENVEKYHRTISTYMNDLIKAGFRVTKVSEPKPHSGMLDKPGMEDEIRRPMFLLVAAEKQ